MTQKSQKEKKDPSSQILVTDKVRVRTDGSQNAHVVAGEAWGTLA